MSLNALTLVAAKMYFPPQTFVDYVSIVSGKYKSRNILCHDKHVSSKQELFVINSVYIIYRFIYFPFRFVVFPQLKLGTWKDCFRNSTV